MVTADSKVVAAKEQLSSDLTGETIILNSKSGVYFGLNAVGASVWNLIQEPKTVNEIRDAILAKYQVEREQCENDILGLLQEMQTEGLIEVGDETAT
ncbi:MULTISPECIES: PqqD family peptide modification chaperone [unclassified Moorena]|uniref:PqqD family peptide modification chaperone n=1 Tax=unclassified Moorena TaxID=2683338 RepID=UPI0013FE54DC|nr:MULTISPECIES: PqqD family peptide modification chaperone [unclassified Moorena]NEO14257.1 PqqD family protein [Moorena sp. SIO3E8]NEQ00204.1 PqqD family protein [Moorena sp. SIO3F7]